MKIETKDELGQDLIIDIEPDVEPRANHLVVTVGHAGRTFVGHLFEGDEMRKLLDIEVDAYNVESTVAGVLQKIARLASKDEEGREDAQLFFSGLLESVMQELSTDEPEEKQP